jgi:hypothetical protein
MASVSLPANNVGPDPEGAYTINRSTGSPADAPMHDTEQRLEVKKCLDVREEPHAIDLSCPRGSPGKALLDTEINLEVGCLQQLVSMPFCSAGHLELANCVLWHAGTIDQVACHMFL